MHPAEACRAGDETIAVSANSIRILGDSRAEIALEQLPTEMQQINGAGGDMTFISLPAIGIHGNSHMMMLDHNNLQVADVIVEWIDRHVRL